MKQTRSDEVANRAAGLECRVEGEPRLRPHQPVRDLLLNFFQHVRVADVQEALDKRLVVVEHIPEDTKSVHVTPPWKIGASLRQRQRY